MIDNFKLLDVANEITEGNYVIGKYYDEISNVYNELHFCNKGRYFDALLIDDVWQEYQLPSEAKGTVKNVIYLIDEGLTIHEDFELPEYCLFWMNFSKVVKKFRTVKSEEFSQIINILPRNEIQSKEIGRNKPIISIITTVFNNAQMLEQTIQSVINQDCSSFEYIIKDAESNDNFLEVIGRYKKYGINIIIKKDNGIYYGMHQGFEAAKGEYLQILNSDDVFYSKEIVSKYIKNIKETDADAYCSDMIMHYSTHKYRRSPNLKKLKYRAYINHSSLVLKKDVYFRVGGFDCKMRSTADRELSIKLIVKKCSIKVLNFVSVNFRGTGLSSQHKVKIYSFIDAIKCSYRYSPLNIGGYLFACKSLVKRILLCLRDKIKKND